MRHFSHASGLWQRLVVADLLSEDVFAQTAKEAGVTVIYSDPPWNPGNEKWWRRHAGAEPPEAYDHFLDRWCLAVTASPSVRHIFSEQSINPRHRGMLLAAVARCPTWTLPLIQEWTVYYGTPGSRGCSRPNTLLHFGESPITTDPSGLRGQAMTLRVAEGLDLPPGSVIGDPCMGKGMTSRVAVANGWCCVGSELNPRRLEFTIRWLTRHGYAPAETVNTLP